MSPFVCLLFSWHSVSRSFLRSLLSSSSQTRRSRGREFLRLFFGSTSTANSAPHLVNQIVTQALSLGLKKDFFTLSKSHLKTSSPRPSVLGIGCQCLSHQKQTHKQISSSPRFLVITKRGHSFYLLRFPPLIHFCHRDTNRGIELHGKIFDIRGARKVEKR